LGHLTGNAGLVYPKGPQDAVFASGLWLGATSDPGAQVRIALAEYSQEYGRARWWRDVRQSEPLGYRVYK